MNRFPKDCRESYETRIRLSRLIALVGGLITLGSVAISLAQGKSEVTGAKFFIGILCTIVGYFYVIRCPACRGATFVPPFRGMSYCVSCGSWLRRDLVSCGTRFVPARVSESEFAKPSSAITYQRGSRPPIWLILILVVATGLVGMFVCSTIIIDLRRNPQGEVVAVYREKSFIFSRNRQVISNVVDIDVGSTHRIKNRSEQMSHLRIVTTNGVVLPGITGRSDPSRFERVAHEARIFLGETKLKTAQVRMRPNLLEWVAFGFLAFVTVAAMSQRRLSLRYDIEKGTLTLERRGSGSGLTFCLDDIESFGVIECNSPNRGGESSVYAARAFRLLGGSIVILDTNLAPSTISDKMPGVLDSERLLQYFKYRSQQKDGNGG